MVTPDSKDNPSIHSPEPICCPKTATEHTALVFLELLLVNKNDQWNAFLLVAVPENSICVKHTMG